MRVVGLYSGIGGIELGLEQAGLTVTALVERDPKCQAVLRRHWPAAAHHDDVETFPAWWERSGLEAEVLAAGFPCQPFSSSGKDQGIDDSRWGWPATERAIRTVRPRFVLLENVARLVRRPEAFGRVLAGLHTLGFDAEWATVSAAHYGAPHSRRRVFVLAYAHGYSLGGPLGASAEGRTPPEPTGVLGMAVAQIRERARAWLASEPGVDRMAYGIPGQLDRNQQLGNAVVPAITEHIGGVILRADREVVGGWTN